MAVSERGEEGDASVMEGNEAGRGSGEAAVENKAVAWAMAAP